MLCWGQRTGTVLCQQHHSIDGTLLRCCQSQQHMHVGDASILPTNRQHPPLPLLCCACHRYITVNATKGRKFFYVFGEAETNPKEAPLIFWMNG